MQSVTRALILAASLLAALLIGVGSAAADDGEQAESGDEAHNRSGQPIELVAAIPDDYGHFFAVQWSGGSLRQLRAQLAVRGCIANTIWLYDGGRWHGYNHFDVPAAINSPFIETYGSFVPSGPLWVNCADLTSRLGDPPPASHGLEPENRPIIADIPGEHDQFFPFRWTGGSLYDLYLRLAIAGCIADIIVVNDDRRSAYSRFSVPAAQNRQFVETYARSAPAGALWADCVDLREVLNDPTATDPTIGAALQPTQVIAEIPDEYDRLFPVQYGGGSLYHLKARLATMGCMANTIILHDDGWRAYNQYNVGAVLIQQFADDYAEFVPAGTLWADCINICTYDQLTGTIDAGRQCLSWAETRDRRRFNPEFRIFDDDAPCAQTYHPDVQHAVTQLLPVLPHLCIVRQIVPGGRGFGGGLYHSTGDSGLLLQVLPVITHNAEEGSPAHRVYQQRGEHLLSPSLDAHELCHGQQNYYDVQQDRPGRPVVFDHPSLGWVERGWIYARAIEHMPDAAQEFIKLVGFRRHSNGWSWVLPRGSIFRNIYSISPRELSAELCSFYILNHAGVPDPAVPNMERYLTPEIVEWLEKYMVLRPIEE